MNTHQHHQCMHWTISVDPRPHHDGPLQFATWLAGRAATDDARRGDHLTGAHILPRLSQLAGLWDRDVVNTLLATVEANCRRNIAGVTTLEVELDLVEADDVHLGLADAAKRHESHCVVIGRHARLEDDRLVRLGRVARRLLRNLPAPLVVTPPNWQAPSDAGPILLSTDLLPHSVPAASFARYLARRYALPLAVAHVAHVFKWIGSGLPAGALDGFAAEAIAAGETATRAWLADREFDAPVYVAAGDPSSALAELALQHRASMIVCGARQLNPMERLFHASVGTDLAASVPCPVVVVPHPHADA